MNNTKKEIDELLKESDNLLNSVSINFFLSVKTEIQKDVQYDLKKMLEQLSAILKKSQKENFSDLSNIIFGQINIYKAAVFELDTYLLMKENKMREAFDSLIIAQDAINTAKASHDVFNNSEIHSWEDKLLSIEKILFPKQLFTSSGSLVKSSKCSICNEDYGYCKHIKGRVYNGVFCTEIITDMEILEISIVKNPASKHCRAYVFSDENEIVDLITRERIKLQEIGGTEQCLRTI